MRESPRRLRPVARALLRIGVERDVCHHRCAVGPCVKDARRSLQRDPADADQRNVADALAPFPDAREALWGEGHLLQNRRVDRPERDIVGARRERAVKLGLVMRRDAEA